MSNAQFNATNKSWDIIASRVYSATNTNLTLEASGPTANLLVKTNGSTIVTADPTGNVTFTNLPICSVLPVSSSQIVNKQYADSLVTTGAQGASGAQGAQGPAGGQGAQGTSGAQGAGGAQGTQGASGAQGSGGGQGAQGASGAQGAGGSGGGQGAQGAQGGGGGQGAQGSAGGGGGTGATGANLTISAGSNFSVSGSEISLQDSVTYVNASAFYMRTTYSSSNNIIFTGSIAGPTWGESSYFYFDGTDFYMNKYFKFPLNTPSSGGGQVRGYVDGSDHLHYFTSSLRYKTNIEILPDSDEILQIDPVFFNYKPTDENPNPVKTIGFIAEEMEKNELGNYFVIRNDDDSCETIEYSTLITLYVSALRTLKTKITNLTDRIENLKENQKNKFEFYEEKISALEKIVEQI